MPLYPVPQPPPIPQGRQQIIVLDSLAARVSWAEIETSITTVAYDARITGATGTVVSVAYDARLTGQDTSNQAWDARLTGQATTSQAWDARVTGQASSNQAWDARLTGQATSNQAWDARITAPIPTANFEKGTPGNTISTSDTGDASAWDTVGVGTSAALTYDNTKFAHGTQSAKFVNGSSGSTYVQWSNKFGTQTDHYGRFYLYLPANIASGTNSLMIVQQTGGGINARIYLRTDGKLAITDSTGSGALGNTTNAVTLNQWVRVEYHIVHHTSAGSMELKLFLTPDSVTPTETISYSAKNTGADVISHSIGWIGVNNTGEIMYIDGITAGAQSYPGPWPESTYTQDARITGQATSSQAWDSRITGYLTSNQAWDARITGQATDSYAQDARLTGQATSSQAWDARITGYLTSSVAYDARLTGQATSNQAWDARITGDNRYARVSWAEIETSRVYVSYAARIFGALLDSIAYDARITGVVPGTDTSVAYDARLTGQATSNQAWDARLTGQDSSNVSYAARLTGQASSSTTQDARLTGQATTSQTYDSRITGQNTSSTCDTVYGSGNYGGELPYNGYCRYDARLTGQATDSRANDARITAYLTNSTTQDVRVSGQAVDSVAQDARITAFLTDNVAYDARISGAASSNATYDARTAGATLDSVNFDVRIRGNELTDSITLAARIVGYTTQRAYPISDTMTVGPPGGPLGDPLDWTAVPSGTLASVLDEAVPDDADYIISPVGSSTPQVCEVLLSSLPDPFTNVNHKVSYRFTVADLTALPITLTVRLMQGATEIAHWTHVALPVNQPGGYNVGGYDGGDYGGEGADTYWQVTQTLTQAQADAITDYSDLRLRFEAVE